MAAKVTMAKQHDDKQAQAFGRQLETAMAAIRERVGELLQAGEIDPRVVALAVAGITGELGASMARAGEGELDEILGDLAKAMRQAGQEHDELLEVALTPAAGNA
jgi:uncharacterized protein YidB (DUF937 family)